MIKRIFNLKNVAIIACLAVTAIFSACGTEPLDKGADITVFTGINGTAIIDNGALTVTATADETLDLTAIKAEFSLSSAKVDNTPRIEFFALIFQKTSSGGNIGRMKPIPLHRKIKVCEINKI